MQNQLIKASAYLSFLTLSLRWIYYSISLALVAARSMID